ncbi:MAG: 30S ribosomal protein S7 [Bacteroidetes bacterium]|nr:30S ribosomal protein S7 [Bacteroidota bacterium]
MRKKAKKHNNLSSDTKFNDPIISLFINNIMKDGKKQLAQTIVYDAFDFVEKKSSNNPVDVFKKAMGNVSPLLEVKARRVGGATYQVPTEVRPERRTALAIRWLISYAKERSDKSMAQKLAAEIFSASNNEGNAVKKKDDVHRMAEANKAFAHFRW